jgi:hypothetical protein
MPSKEIMYLDLTKMSYGQKSAGRVWNQYLTNKLTKEVGFTQSKTDDCVFFKGNVVYLLYTDDSILAGPSKKEIESVIQEIRDGKLNITVEGDIQDFLGVNIERKADGTVHLTQPHLILQLARQRYSQDSQSQPLLNVHSTTDASSGN